VADAINKEVERFSPGTGTGVPGVTAAVFLPKKWATPVALARGYSDFEAKITMRPEDEMLAGSIGKTFFAAAALRLAARGKLDLDRPISAYLPGFAVPNGKIVTARMLLSHTSGYSEFDERFMDDLIARPLATRDLNDWLGPIQRNPPGSPGKFRYSDINFMVLASVVSAAAGQSSYDLIREELLQPLRLKHTRPADRPDLPGLVPGYAGSKNPFGADKVMVKGRLIYNPQFEWGGGGFRSSSPDLARWIYAVRSGKAFPSKLWPEVSRPVSVDEKGEGYGLGIHINPTRVGTAYGHGGYIPGYFSWVRWYEDPGFSVAAQTNTSDDSRLKFNGYEVLDAIAQKVAMICK